MKRMPVTLLLLSSLALALPARAASAADEVSPETLVRERTAKILELIKANRESYNRDVRQLFAMVDKEVLPYFDFSAMARSVLGRYWREANEDQRARFTAAFREMLVRTYATALLKYTDEEIVYLPYTGQPGDRTAVVRTEVRRGGGAPPVPIHYGFYKNPNGWKVYDITVEGVSLVTSYRASYAEKIQKEGLEALIASIERSNREAAAKSATGRSGGGGGVLELPHRGRALAS
jgi:phospholipid transport system substrate-binding protein